MVMFNDRKVQRIVENGLLSTDEKIEQLRATNALLSGEQPRCCSFRPRGVWLPSFSRRREREARRGAVAAEEFLRTRLASSIGRDCPAIGSPLRFDLGCNRRAASSASQRRVLAGNWRFWVAPRYRSLPPMRKLGHPVSNQTSRQASNNALKR